MRHSMALALGLIPFIGWAQPQATPIPSSIEPSASIPAVATPIASATDTFLQSLIQESLERNPELAKIKTLTEAEQERIPQAKALADPALTLGLQNDGFKKLQIGMMESSYYQMMLTQPLSWPGKRGLRGEIASLGVEALRATTDRTRLSLIAEVKRAYVGLLLVRKQIELLKKKAL